MLPLIYFSPLCHNSKRRGNSLLLPAHSIEKPPALREGERLFPSPEQDFSRKLLICLNVERLYQAPPSSFYGAKPRRQT